jgi:ABC-type Mn2+/Zn2+ transport system ATPase subunit
MDDLSVIRKAGTDSGAHDYIRSFESFYKTSLGMDFPMPDGTFQTNPISYNPDREIPFMVKALTGALLARGKYDDKFIIWGPKPKKREIDIEIPEHQASNVSEPVSWRALSGGQWQRIALARAFMKIKEADLLILDEPSSALDPQAEYQVFKTIMELRKNKTTIYIV